MQIKTSKKEIGNSIMWTFENLPIGLGSLLSTTIIHAISEYTEEYVPIAVRVNGELTSPFTVLSEVDSSVLEITLGIAEGKYIISKDAPEMFAASFTLTSKAELNTKNLRSPYLQTASTGVSLGKFSGKGSFVLEVIFRKQQGYYNEAMNRKVLAEADWKDGNQFMALNSTSTRAYVTHLRIVSEGLVENLEIALDNSSKTAEQIYKDTLSKLLKNMSKILQI